MASILIFATIFASIGVDKVSARERIPKIRLSVKPLDISNPPTTKEIMAAGQLGGQLYYTHDLMDEREKKEINRSFGAAIQEWNKHEYKKAIKLFKSHIEKYPDSPWTSEAVLHIGCDAQYNGRYTEAEESFHWILEKNRNIEHEGANILMNKAKLRLGVLKVLQNNFKEAKGLFRDLKKESSDWRDRTYAAHWIQRLSRYTANERAMLNCGTQSLVYLLKKDGQEAKAKEVMELLPETVQGHSLQDLSDIAALYGYNFAGVRISALKLKEIPSIVEGVKENEER